MTTQHTPGRLTVKHMVGIYQKDGCLVASVHTPITHNGSENARRLVACWNACEGVPTEKLENFAAVGAIILSQRDELLAALKLARGALRQAATDVSDWGAYAPAHFQTKHKLADDVQAYNNAADSAHAAIAKAEGGAE